MGWLARTPKVETAIENHVETNFRRRPFRFGLVLRTVPFALEDLETAGHFLAVQGKYLLMEAAGTRLGNRYHWYNDGKRDADGETIAYFDALQKRDPVPPVWSGPTGDLGFVIDARNDFDFYHFATETIGQLCLLDRDDFNGQVYIHSDREEVKPFIQDWIDHLFFSAWRAGSISRRVGTTMTAAFRSATRGTMVSIRARRP